MARMATAGVSGDSGTPNLAGRKCTGRSARPPTAASHAPATPATAHGGAPSVNARLVPARAGQRKSSLLLKVSRHHEHRGSNREEAHNLTDAPSIQH